MILNKVFIELFRITKKNGYVAFEVGEIRNKKINYFNDYFRLKINVN